MSCRVARPPATLRRAAAEGARGSPPRTLPSAAHNCGGVRQCGTQHYGVLRSRSPWSLALLASSALLSLSAALVPGSALAQDCQPLREVRPLRDEPLPANGYIWDVCYYVVNGDREGARSDEVCAAPRLFDAQGKAVPLELDRSADAPPTRRVARYRPQEPLRAGETYSLEPGQYARPSGRRSVRVVAAAEAAPEPPELLSIDYQVRGTSAVARFQFAEFTGLLLKDVGAQGQPSLGAVDVSRLELAAAPELELLQEPCRENFAAQPGASTMLRFGALDLAGNFSGWGETVNVQFPTSDTEFSTPSATEDDGGDEGGCAVKPGAGARDARGLLAAALLAGVVAVGRRRVVERG